MGRHGPSVVIRALELVVRVALLRCVAVMNGARDCQTLGDQFRRSFGDHLGRSLILEPAHAFVEVVVLRVVHEIVTDPADDSAILSSSLEFSSDRSATDRLLLRWW